MSPCLPYDLDCSQSFPLPSRRCCHLIPLGLYWQFHAQESRILGNHYEDGPCSSKVHLMPFHFFKRPTLVLPFSLTNRNLKKIFAFMGKKSKCKNGCKRWFCLKLFTGRAENATAKFPPRELNSAS